jgi:hypothetical protein
MWTERRREGHLIGCPDYELPPSLRIRSFILKIISIQGRLHDLRKPKHEQGSTSFLTAWYSNQFVDVTCVSPISTEQEIKYKSKEDFILAQNWKTGRVQVGTVLPGSSYILNRKKYRVRCVFHVCQNFKVLRRIKSSWAVTFAESEKKSNVHRLSVYKSSRNPDTLQKYVYIVKT